MLVRTTYALRILVFFFQAEDGIRDLTVTGVQTCALPISAFWGWARTAKLKVASRPVWKTPSKFAKPAAPTRSMPLLKLPRSEEHTSELQSQSNLVCRLLLEKKKNKNIT